MVAALDETILNTIISSGGDLSKLNPDQKIQYYRHTCERLGLDPLTQPFRFLRLNGRDVMYCDRAGAQQLNRLHHVSHSIAFRETVSGVYAVAARASTPDGRFTESLGAVPTDGLKGDNLANAMMKAETKAKRRATLDLLGLGILDELEVETIPNAKDIPTPGDAAPPVPPAAGGTAAAPAGGGDQKPVNRSPFKRKYDSPQEIESVLNTAEIVQDIANLYYLNTEMIEAHSWLKQQFTKKKQEFYNTPGIQEAVDNAAGAKSKTITEATERALKAAGSEENTASDPESAHIGQ